MFTKIGWFAIMTAIGSTAIALSTMVNSWAQQVLESGRTLSNQEINTEVSQTYSFGLANRYNFEVPPEAETIDIVATREEGANLDLILVIVDPNGRQYKVDNSTDNDRREIYRGAARIPGNWQVYVTSFNQQPGKYKISLRLLNRDNRLVQTRVLSETEQAIAKLRENGIYASTSLCMLSGVSQIHIGSQTFCTRDIPEVGRYSYENGNFRRLDLPPTAIVTPIPTPNHSVNNNTVPATEQTGFWCDDTTVETKYQRPDGQVQVWIRWQSTAFQRSGYSPLRRCQEVSSRLENYRRNRQLNFITVGRMNGQNVICTATESGSCTNLIYTLRPDERDPMGALQAFLAWRTQSPRARLRLESEDEFPNVIDLRPYLEENSVVPKNSSDSMESEFERPKNTNLPEL